MTDRTCATCEWFDGSVKCHLNPPPWISVSSKDWCGHYQRSEAETQRKSAELHEHIQKKRNQLTDKSAVKR